MYLNEQAANADDNQAELKKLRVCYHSGKPSFPEIRGQEAALCETRANRIPLLAALKDNSFLLPEYHSFQQNATEKITEQAVWSLPP